MVFNPNLEISKKNVISSNNFSRNSDIVYAQFTSNAEFESIKKRQDVEIISKVNDLVLYKINKFELHENNVIFCNTLLLESLFSHLKNVKKFKNIKLITSQADIAINRNMFEKKPECVSKWYAINVAYKHSDLIPIPLGISENRNGKNLIYEDFNFANYNLTRENKALLNFNLNTNYFHRYKFVKKAMFKNWINIKKPNLEYKEYLEELIKSKFTLAPWGNGFDTHRIWESIYAGSIPVTINHYAFSSFYTLPIIFLNSINDLEIDKLNEYKFQTINKQALTIDWWVEKIREDHVYDSGEGILFDEDFKTRNKNKQIYIQNIKKINKAKKFNTIKRKIHKKIIGRKINKIIAV